MEQSKFYQIKNVTEHEYTLVGCDGSVITRQIQDVDRLASAFTIKDAKDGDILASKSGNKIFSYRGNLDLRGNPCAYYGIYKVHDGICFSPCAIGNSFTWEEVVPATKEQCRILFEEKTAAKGVLHFSKKELKKIEDDKVVIKKGEQNPAWSKEDELHIRELESLVKQVWATAEHENDKDTIHKMSDLSFFLKTLKPQNTWKPSDAQMIALNDVITNWHLSNVNERILKGLQDQLKKLK